MAVNLKQGAIARICNSDNFSFDNNYKPVLQVVHSRHPRILWLSDGLRSSIPGILAPNLEVLLTSRKLQKSSIVKLTRFMVDKQVHNAIVILDLEVILDKCKRIGEPPLLTEIALPLPDAADLQFFNRRSKRMTVNLTQGAITIMESDYFSQDDEFIPVLQVSDVSQLFGRRILLSDGWNSIVGIFVRGLYEFDSNRLQKGTIIKLTNFCVKKFHKDEDCKTLIIIDLDVIEDKCDLIGHHPLSLPDNVPCSQFASPDDSNSCNCNQFVRIPSPIEKKASMNVNLTEGAIMRICCDNLSYLKEFKPVLQVFKFQNRVIFLSDGSHYMEGILSMACEDSVHSKRLQKGSIVKINHFIIREGLQNHRIICVLDLVILEECVLVGEPKPVPLPINAPSPLNMSGLSIS